MLNCHSMMHLMPYPINYELASLKRAILQLFKTKFIPV